MLRNPALIAIEIGWRWVFGSSAIALCLFAFVRLQRAVVILPEEMSMFGSRAPLQIAEAILEVWHRIQPLAVRLGLVMIPAIVILWLVAATVGRGFVINRVFEPVDASPCWSALTALQLLRVLSLFALIGAYVGCSRATVLVSPPDAPNYALALLVFLALFGVAVVIWSLAHWVLSIACIFSAREATSTITSLRKTFVLLRESGRQLSSVAGQNGVIRTLAGIIFTFVALFPLAFLKLPVLFWMLEVVILLAYCAVSDVLLLVRLSGYVEVIQSGASSGAAAEN